MVFSGGFWWFSIGFNGILVMVLSGFLCFKYGFWWFSMGSQCFPMLLVVLDSWFLMVFYGS